MPVERSIDYSRAPSPKRLDAQPPGGSVLVLGDSMADWLAFGLEDALGDPPIWRSCARTAPAAD